MYRLITVYLCLTLMVIVTCEGKSVGRGTHSQKTIERGLEADDAPRKEVRETEDILPLAAKLGLYHGIFYTFRYGTWDNVPKEVLTKEWDIRYKDEEWFKNNTMFRNIHNTILYCTKPEMRKELDGRLLIEQEGKECGKVTDDVRQKLIKMFAMPQCKDGAVENSFPTGVEYLPKAMGFLGKHCDMRIKQMNELDASLWGSSSQGRKKRAYFGSLDDLNVKSLDGLVKKRDENNIVISTGGLKGISQDVDCLGVKYLLNITFSKNCGGIREQMPVYVDALTSGDEKTVRSVERIFKKFFDDHYCWVLGIWASNFDRALQRKGTAVEQFLSHNLNYASGFKELYNAGCAK